MNTLVTFRDGPAQRASLELARAPLYLRAVLAGEKWDALDQFDDVAQANGGIIAECIRQGYNPLTIPAWGHAAAARNWPRRIRQRALWAWREWLCRTFGDIDRDTLPCEAPADTLEPPF